MKKQILIVDDEPRLAQLMAMALEDAGYEVSIARNGIDALKQAWTVPYPDLIVLDWNMPRMTGLEVCKRLRQSHFGNPIVFVTGMGDRPHRDAARQAGADAYIIKPFTDDDLITTIDCLLNPDCAYAA
jgi:DNA-binding response OmpR family regulator